MNTRSTLSTLFDYLLKRSLLLPLIALQAIQIALVPPIDLPSNDDWMYAEMTRTLVNEHQYVHHPFVQPTSVVHVLGGAVFAQFFGQSYVTLRAATLVLGLVGAWAAAKCAMACGLTRRAALLTGVVVLVNPLYVYLSNTFMTDVPFLAYMSLSALFYLKALRSNRSIHILCGSSWGLVAFFVRQFGVIPAVAYVIVTFLVCVRRRNRPALGHIVAYFVPWMVAGAGYVAWMRTRHDIFEWAPTFGTGRVIDRAMEFLGYGVVIATLMGLFILPIAIVRVWSIALGRERWPWPKWLVFIGSACAMGSVFIFYLQSCMPMPGNNLHMVGVGPRTIAGLSVNQAESVKILFQVWYIATAFGVLSASLLAVGFFTPASTHLRTQVLHPAQSLYLVIWLLLVFLSSYTPYTSVPFDRYTLPMLVPVAILGSAWIARRIHRRAVWSGALLAALMYVYAIAGLQDYQAWNTARWAALNHLMTELRVPPQRIDGGYEFNGIYNSREWLVKNRTNELRTGNDLGWWVLDNSFRVTFSPITDHTPIGAVPYFSWLGMSTRQIYALERSDAAQPSGP
jgi:hypothetical protein